MTETLLMPPSGVTSLALLCLSTARRARSSSAVVMVAPVSCVGVTAPELVSESEDTALTDFGALASLEAGLWFFVLLRLPSSLALPPPPPLELDWPLTMTHRSAAWNTDMPMKPVTNSSKRLMRASSSSASICVGTVPVGAAMPMGGVPVDMRRSRAAVATAALLLLAAFRSEAMSCKSSAPKLENASPSRKGLMGADVEGVVMDGVAKLSSSAGDAVRDESGPRGPSEAGRDAPEVLAASDIMFSP
mmetsp:Transcript_5707/g.16019  ORF Transcript_5707/g.16019 Transcript_5707/m.16019 type:complete len:247 (-) Transcript_5707:1170-1910(-)